MPDWEATIRHGSRNATRRVENYRDVRQAAEAAATCYSEEWGADPARVIVISCQEVDDEPTTRRHHRRKKNARAPRSTHSFGDNPWSGAQGGDAEAGGKAGDRT